MKVEVILGDLEKAIERLKDALATPATTDLSRAGCIQYFEFCFELAWKSIKMIGQEQGCNQCDSPKSSLKLAFASGWIDEEEIWLEMLSARNRMAHTYDANEALKIHDSLGSFCGALEDLLAALKQESQ